MYRVLDCITVDHDPYLVVLAAIICAFGAAASSLVATRIASSGRAGAWIALLAINAGSTVWATHFLAMLAFRTTLPMSYDPGLTLLSYLIGVFIIGFSVRVAHGGQRRARGAIAGGVLLGSGVAALHYAGMAALRFPGHLSYDVDLVIISVLLSIALGISSMWVGRRLADAHARTLAAALFVAMTVTLHFTGMGAVRLELSPLAADAAGMSRSALAIAVTVAALVVLLIGITAAIVDQRIASRLASEAERFRTLADGALEGLLVHRDGLIVDANAAARAMFGLNGPVAAATRLDTLLDAAGIARMKEPIDDERAFELSLLNAQGAYFPAEVSRRHIKLADGLQGELLAIRDLTTRKKSEARIAHLALHDPLTDLPNRRLFLELANKAMGHAQRTNERFGILAIDLDGFKTVNDMHGHAAGDELLRTVARRIQSELRDADVVARFGGDEFAILQSFTTQPRQAMALAERLLETLQTPIRLADAEVAISASIGVALYPDDGATTEDLLRNADTAMYRAKADGKATCRFFEAQMDAALESRRRLEFRLRHAITSETLEIAFQPLVGSRDGHPVAFEALVRWNDAELGYISPADFIPVAEETGLILPIGEFVLRRACMEAASWSQPLSVAVNLSAVQFRRRGLVDMVQRALTESGLPGERLELEVTESLLIDNRDEVLRTLTALKEMGIRIAMDDFGTGYSSLSYLQSFPFDKIKIDRSFVTDLEADSQNASIVRAVASMGRSLQMQVVAEGVETRSQAALLKDLDCDELQGYLIARPMPAAEIEAFLQEHPARVSPADAAPAEAAA
ncbi:bifunctional diguanylate cyclase/phosphodiesterase [Methyloversatilis universalis]|uniref:bifunctional diguanylate cyclase/phosphodiesterase n=1 Tax=Methyloversatilis universalis TaxID=378211 RepID=UPI000373D3E1|nr:EAL domain-containing protein [Methyloversatilis universalis]